MCGCAAILVKYALFLFNFFFVLAGIAFIAIGTVFKLNIDQATELLEDLNIDFSIAPTLAIVVGVVVFIIAFFGCCGAIKESSCMLTTYAIILLTIFILQVALGVYAFLQYKETDDELKTKIADTLQKAYDKYPDNEVKEPIDVMQSSLECCGPRGPAFWQVLPSSCCPEKPSVCLYPSAYKEGCVDKLYNYLNGIFDVIGIVVIVIAAVEIGGAIIALCLSSSIRNAERRGNYA